ncbi:MAG: Abi family protein [Crocinitomicaceae bacterium]|nr:Abi family protein [Crocinitomicaceae bacterium]MBK8927150.1 Abi family protein [Crocinitomicaceae bacterium]
MEFEKSAFTLDDQIDLLKERGMIISNDAKAKEYLSNISYYRLSAYWYTLLENPKTDHLFIEGTTFETAIDTYIFDRKLRLIIFDELERIEIAMRTTLIYNYCLDYGNNWYEDKALYRGKDTYFYKFQTILIDEMDKTSEVFIKHYRSKYTKPANPPAWMALELISFGQLSMLFKNLKNCNARKNVATHFGLDEHVFESWLDSLSYVRNTCAHHMRLWNRKIPRTPILPKNSKQPWLRELPPPDRNNRIYISLCMIAYLLKSVSPGNSFALKVSNLLDKYPKVPKQYMGFTNNWKSELLWKINP